MTTFQFRPLAKLIVLVLPSLCLACSFVLPASLKKPCVVKALWFDLCWLVLLTGLWLGESPRLSFEDRRVADLLLFSLASAATVCWTVVHGSLKEDYCPTEGYQYGLPDGYTREFLFRLRVALRCKLIWSPLRFTRQTVLLSARRTPRFHLD